MEPPQIWDHFASHQCPKFGTILHHINAPNLGALLRRPIGDGSSSHPPHRTTPNLGPFCITSMPQIWDHFWGNPLGKGPHLTAPIEPPQIWDHFASPQCPKFGSVLHHINAPNLGPLLGRPIGEGSTSHPPHRTTPNLGLFCITSMPQIWVCFASHQCPKSGTTFEAPQWGRVHISQHP